MLIGMLAEGWSPQVIAAVELPVLVTGILLGLCNVVVGVVVGVNSYLLRRLVGQNDESHARMDGRIDRLGSALAGEVEARHAAGAHVTEQLSEVREDRPRREEVLGQYNTVLQRINDLSGELRSLAGRLEGSGRARDE